MTAIAVFIAGMFTAWAVGVALLAGWAYRIWRDDLEW